MKIQDFRKSSYRPEREEQSVQDNYNETLLNKEGFMTLAAPDAEPLAEDVATAETEELAISVPAPLKEYAVASRSVGSILDYAAINRKQVKYLLSTLTEEEREKVKAAMKQKIKSKAVINDLCWTIDTTDTEHPYMLYNLLTVQESKMLLALQKCLSDQTENIHGLIEDGRKVKKEGSKKASSKKADSKELATVSTSTALGMSVEEFPDAIQKAVKNSKFKQYGIIAITPADLLCNYLGIKKATPDDKQALDVFLNKLHSGRFAVIEKNSRGGVGALTVQATLLDWHTEDGKYIIVLGELFCSLVNNYIRLPENQAEILNAIGKSDIMYHIYLMILQEMSYNEPGVKIVDRPQCRLVERSERRLLEKYFKPGDQRRESVKLEAMYRAFNVFHDNFKLLCKPVEKIQRDGEVIVRFYVNRGVFDKRNKRKHATE